ncbi:MAG: FAD-binding protein [Bacteroidota bacterium]|nr:FAD-binding protein [Bacteroidota bacterium]
MPQELELKLLPSQVFDDVFVKNTTIKILGVNDDSIQSIQYLKRSIDARKKSNIVYVLKVKVYFKNENIVEENNQNFEINQLSSNKKVGIIGFGPAGMFAALQLLEKGIKPIIFERGKTVKDRRRDLAQLNKLLIVNTESNYCFGEGGAGTYSDGKLYTRSKKRGDIQKVLKTFVKHGADPDILVNSHPHIGTNKLPQIIENIRETILHAGGEIHFNAKLTDLIIVNQKIKSILINDKQIFEIDELILATGHSARDIFNLLDNKKIKIEAKPFALGVRIEHPQSTIDLIQYGLKDRGEYLPPSSYSLVTQAAGNGVFSFCMCPGGIIAPAATNQNEIVVNGWSPSKRNGFYANSGMVVTVNEQHWQKQYGNHALSALNFQKNIENIAFNTSGSIIAPAQRMDDFIHNKLSDSLPPCSYLPGVHTFDLRKVLPHFIANSLCEGLTHFGKTLKGYRTNDALLVGVESRTSSPVRIPREKETLRHVEISNLLPCGEGAGYAGGIMSAALDGMACALAIN